MHVDHVYSKYSVASDEMIKSELVRHRIPFLVIPRYFDVVCKGASLKRR